MEHLGESEPQVFLYIILEHKATSTLHVPHFTVTGVGGSHQSKLLSRLSSWVRFSLRTRVKRISQRSAESRGFSPGAPVSSHRESWQGGLE
jgi:hypothetical protein